MSLEDLSYVYLNKGNNHNIPILCYGPVSELRKAFIFGAEDYLRDPWGMEELEIRVMKIVRFDRLSLMGHNWRIVSPYLQGATAEVELNTKEERILRCLISHQGEPVSREQLRAYAWQKEVLDLKSRSLDMHISNLRRKLSESCGQSFSSKEIILTRKPDGYMIPSQLLAF